MEHEGNDALICEDTTYRLGGVYVWESRKAANANYTPEWKAFIEDKYGSPPEIEYLHSPVMVDNRDGTINVAA